MRHDHQRQIGRQQQRVSVGGRFRDLVGPNHSAGARTIVDDDLLGPHLGEMLGQNAGEGIDRATRRIWNDDVHRFCGILGKRRILRE